MARTNFQYDETGNTYYYVFLIFLALVLCPATYYLFFVSSDSSPKKRKNEILHDVAAKDSEYYLLCQEKVDNMERPKPGSRWKRALAWLVVGLGWLVFGMLVYQILQFDYEMANFDPFDILAVSPDATQKEIKKRYRELSLIHHPDKPTGDEKLFMKINKAYTALTDETARLNWEQYGNPDGPQSMEIGIGLPAWIVEEKNSLFVLLGYAVFMIILLIAVYFWWSNSSKYSSEQVLLLTIQIYWHFILRSSNMTAKRVLHLLAASAEFDKAHNPEVVIRPEDDVLVPKLMKSLPDLGCKKRNRLGAPYAMKARTLLFAHISRISLPKTTLHPDRLLIIKKCPLLINEMVTNICTMITIHNTGQMRQEGLRAPSIVTLENVMSLSPMIVQAVWKNQFVMQLPHIVQDHLRDFTNRKRSIKTMTELARLKDADRLKLFRRLREEQYSDVCRVLRSLPSLDVEAEVTVVDDEDRDKITAGAITTVTVSLIRHTLERYFSNPDAELREDSGSDREDEQDQETSKKKLPVWMKQGKKKKSVKKIPKKKQKQKVKKDVDASAKTEEEKDEQGEKDEPVSDFESEKNEDDEIEEDIDDDDDEWERLKEEMQSDKKTLERKSNVSHSVHAPHFRYDKQECWWVYIVSPKEQKLITPVNHVTSLLDHKDIKLRFTAPKKPGRYTYTVCVRSDSYLGLDITKELKINVGAAHSPVEEHPQWKSLDDEEEGDKLSDSDEDLASDDEYSE